LCSAISLTLVVVLLDLVIFSRLHFEKNSFVAAILSCNLSSSASYPSHRPPSAFLSLASSRLRLHPPRPLFSWFRPFITPVSMGGPYLSPFLTCALPLSIPLTHTLLPITNALDHSLVIPLKHRRQIPWTLFRTVSNGYLMWLSSFSLKAPHCVFLALRDASHIVSLFALLSTAYLFVILRYTSLSHKYEVYKLSERVCIAV
jgi:hypothetical protein